MSLVCSRAHKDNKHSNTQGLLWRSHLGLALEVKGEDVLSTPCFALADQEDAVARRAAGQHQLSSFETGQRAVEPLTLAERVFNRLCSGRLREQEGPCTGECYV